jgi:drug/metabolite transporter (DMT)-like permease
MFFLIGYSTRKSGVAVTTIASKMSMVVPVLFSMLYFSEKSGFLKISGLAIAAVAVFLSSYRPINESKGFLLFILPIIIFLGSGITDSLVKYAQTYYIPNNISLLFSTVVFFTALVFGIIYTLVRRNSISASFSLAEIIGGTILGIANFGSLYFFILALNNSKLDSSIVFGLNNICIVLLSVLIGSTIFKEKLTKVNFAGIILALAAILILMIY